MSIPKGLPIENVDLDKAKYLCSLPKIIGKHPDINEDITINIGRFGPYLKCSNKSARIESIDELFSIGLNRAITLISEAKPGRMSSSEIKNLGEHPEDKKPVKIMKGQYGPYIKYKSLNATIPEDKDPAELTMEEALILIEKRREYDKTKKKVKKDEKNNTMVVYNSIYVSWNIICSRKERSMYRIKRFCKKSKCLKNKYDTAHKNAPKTGVEQFKKITNK